VFKFRIELPENYPNDCPKVFFETYVFHPLVDSETGELNITPQFPTWRARKDFVFVILAYIKKIFYNREYYTMAQYVKNPVAFQLFHTDEEGFL
jgi:ubiquitin-protein ligase